MGLFSEASLIIASESITIFLPLIGHPGIWFSASIFPAGSFLSSMVILRQFPLPCSQDDILIEFFLFFIPEKISERIAGPSSCSLSGS
jgi:hypothetical protein